MYMRRPTDQTGSSLFRPTTAAPWKPEQGAATITLVFGFLVFGSLILAVLNMSATSQLQVVSSTLSSRAYYLAESGFRIAAAYYLNSGDENGNNFIDDDKADLLNDFLDGSTFSIEDKGEVTLGVFPYWMVSTDASGTYRSAVFPGQVPPSFDMPAKGHLLFLDSSDPSSDPVEFSYSNGNLNTNTGTFTYNVSENVPAIPSARESLYFFLNPASDTVFSHGSNLQLSMFPGYSEAMFPKYQGIIQLRTTSLDPDLYTYRRADYDEDQHVLTLSNLRKISDPDNTAAWSESIDTATSVIFKKFLILESHGQVGTEERMLRYFTPIQDSRSLPADLTFVPKTKIDWERVTSVDDSVLDWDVRKLSSSGGGQGIFAELKKLSSSNENKVGTFWYKDINEINKFWKAGAERLSYNVQVKAATGVDLPHVATGISFRARGSILNNPDSYLGVSFMRYSLPTVYFRNGRQISSVNRDIAPGDTVEFGSFVDSENWESHGTAIVQGTPLLTSGSYPDGNARGSLRLANLTSAPGQSSPVRADDQIRINTETFAQVLNYVQEEDDQIPDEIKPKPDDFNIPNYDIGSLLLVLWKREGNTWEWLAYKDITEDEYVRGLQDWKETNPPPFGSCTGGSCPGYDGQVINDNVSLLLQVREKRDSGSGTKFNDINVFYGDASTRFTSGRPGNNISYDILDGRKRYGRSSESGVTYFPTWPPQRLAFWSQNVDYFSHVENPTVSGTPHPEFQWDALNPNFSGTLLSMLHDGTIRTSELTTYESPAYMDYLQHEIGLHGMGEVDVSNEYYAGVSFTDFAVRFVFDNAKHYGGFLEPFVM